MALSRFIKLPKGQLMPIIGFGTWQAKDEELAKAVDHALKTGYRHIDTAMVYENETVIGQVLKKWLDSGKITREELFIVTKLPPSGHRNVEKYMKKSLSDLQLDYVDLYLIHTPFAFEEVEGELHPMNEKGEIRIDKDSNILKVWREMEEQVDAGRARAIGVSNFNVDQISRILKTAKKPISSLQIELHVYFQQTEMVDFCKQKDIVVTAYSPLGTRGLVKMMGKTDVLPNLLEIPLVKEIAMKHDKTPAQVLLKFTTQNGIAVIPKSTNPKRIEENFQLMDWELSCDEMENLRNLDKGPSARICNFSFFKGLTEHPEFPFKDVLIAN